VVHHVLGVRHRENFKFPTLRPEKYKRELARLSDQQIGVFGTVDSSTMRSTPLDGRGTMKESSYPWSRKAVFPIAMIDFLDSTC
jgi:hypothetical protein